MAVKKPTRYPSLHDRLDGVVELETSPLYLAEGMVQRVRDRVDWWLANTKRVSRTTTRKSGDNRTYVKVHIDGLMEMRDTMVVLLGELTKWREVLWPQGIANILTRSAFQAQLNYRLLYESERRRNNKAVKLALRLHAKMSQKEIEDFVARMDHENIEHFYELATRRELLKLPSE